jgi:pyruvate/2-oxoglutarate dehydrogenase complex dihydrolipoamide dehydrogenase (E3) component
MKRYNMIVIGAGAGGLTAAAIAAHLGAKVALLEKHRMGGECLNYGCVPSKAFLKAAKVVHVIRRAADYGLVGIDQPPPQDLKQVMGYVRAVQARIAPHDSVERFTGLGVEVFLNSGRLRSPHEVELVETGEALWGRHIVLATGSRPLIPPISGLADAGFLTNETVFDCDTLPESLAVIGGGPIGVELGQAFARLGATVTVVSGADHILPREDADVAEVLARRLRQEGVTIWDRSRAVRVEWRNGKKQVGIRTPEGERIVAADEILVAAGRVPNTDGLGLDQVGVDHNERGVRIGPTCRTNVPSIWAVGDVAGRHYFSHWSSYQARIVARNVLFPGSSRCDYDTVPWTTFTDPEVARVGESESGARAKNLPFDIVTASFSDNDRAVCDGETEGFAKVLTRRRGGRILGAAIVHSHAGDLLAELIVAKRHGISLAKLSSTIHVYPTLSEINRTLGDTSMLRKITPPIKATLATLFGWMRR